MRPVAAQLVERSHHLRPSDLRRTPACPSEPLLHRGPRGQARGFTPQQLGDRETCLGCTTTQSIVDIVIEIPYLYRLRHPPTLHAFVQEDMHRRMNRRTVTGSPEGRAGPPSELAAELDVRWWMVMGR